MPAPPLPRDRRPKENQVKDSRILRFSLSREETDRLLKDVPPAYNTEINDILLAALALAVNDWTGAERVPVYLEGHGREDVMENIDINRTIGWFTSVYPVILQPGNPEDLPSLVKNTGKMLRSIVNKGFGYMVLKYLTPPDRKKDTAFHLEPDIHFNYLGQFDQDIDTGFFELSDMPAGLTTGSNCERLCPLSIDGMIVGGCLEMSLDYNKHEFSTGTMTRFQGAYKNRLLQLINHCSQKEDLEMTPGDFSEPGIGEEGVRAIMDALADITDG